MKFNKLQQALIGLGVIILVGLVVEMIVLKDDKKSIKRTRDQISELEQKIRVAKAIQQTAEELQEQMNHLKAQLERLKKILPLEVNKPRFMSDVKRYANENGIEIVKVTNNMPVVDDVIVEHPMTYVSRGNYHDFGSFFAQLTNYPRIINVKGVSLVRDEKHPSYAVEGSFIVSVFTYKEPTEEELKAQIQAKKEERKKKR